MEPQSQKYRKKKVQQVSFLQAISKIHVIDVTVLFTAPTIPIWSYVVCFST
jgi:hypothetical protein